jgi:hypothetical protein
MPRRLSPLSLICCVSTALALLVPAVGPARAQERPGMLPPDGQAAFEKAYRLQRPTFDLINKPMEGEKASKESKEHRDAIDMAAQFYTYRLTWPNNDAAGEVDKIMQAFLNEVNAADGDAMRKGNPGFTEMFLQALAKRARDVVQTRMQIAAVNGGRMLARLAKAGSVEAGDACLEALQNANDFLDPKARAGVQYWALQGLGDLLARWAEPPAPGAEGAAAVVPGQKEREAKYVEALVNVIEQFVSKGGTTPAGAAPPSPDEVRGLQMFRREAVRALAQYRSPAVADDKGATIKVKSALTLLKVIANDGLTPPSRLDERIEAAIGIARLRCKAVPSYQPDYAAQQIGYVVVQMGAETKPPRVNPTKFPWKVAAARLGDALEAMRADAKGTPDKGDEYVNKMVTQSMRILREGIEMTGAATTGGDLRLWLVTNAPPHNSLYKGVPDSTVRSGYEETPEKPAEPAKKPGDKKPDEKKPDAKKPEDKKPGKP